MKPQLVNIQLPTPGQDSVAVDIGAVSRDGATLLTSRNFPPGRRVKVEAASRPKDTDLSARSPTATDMREIDGYFALRAAVVAQPRRSVRSCIAPTWSEIHVWLVRPEHLQHGGRARTPHGRGEGLAVVVVGPFGALLAGSGHMGATPQPNQSIANHGNQRRKVRKSGISNVSERNQRSGESIDTVGVTGSIPVSPTTRNRRITGVEALDTASATNSSAPASWRVRVRLSTRIPPIGQARAVDFPA